MVWMESPVNITTISERSAKSSRPSSPHRAGMCDHQSALLDVEDVCKPEVVLRADHVVSRRERRVAPSGRPFPALLLGDGSQRRRPVQARAAGKSAAAGALVTVRRCFGPPPGGFHAPIRAPFHNRVVAIDQIFKVLVADRARLNRKARCPRSTGHT